MKSARCICTNSLDSSRYKKSAHREDSGLLVEVDGVHDDEDLLVLVRQPARLLQGGLAVVLNPSMLAQEGGWQPDGQACNQEWVLKKVKYKVDSELEYGWITTKLEL